MSAVLLINPNTSSATTAMMVAAARVRLPPGLALRGIGATRGIPMIVDEAALAQRRAGQALAGPSRRPVSQAWLRALTRALTALGDGAARLAVVQRPAISSTRL